MVMPEGQQIDVRSHFICKAAGCHKGLLYGPLVLGDFVAATWVEAAQNMWGSRRRVWKGLCQESAVFLSL